MPSDRIVGLDIGTSTVRAILTDFVDGRLNKIVGLGESRSDGVRAGSIVDITLAADSIVRALKAAKVSDPSQPIRRVVVGISGQQIASLNSSSVIAVTRSSRRIGGEDVARAIEQSKVIVLPPDREILHCIPRSYRVDGQDGVHRPEGMFGNRLELDAHIVTSTFSHAQNIDAALRGADLEPLTLVLNSIGSGEVVLLPEERKLGVVVVNIGEGTTDIAIYIDGNVKYTAVISVGSGQITDDLCKAFRISPDDAEQIKRCYRDFSPDLSNDCDDNTAAVEIIGTGEKKRIASTDVSSIIAPRIQELMSLIRAEIIKSRCYGLLPAGAVLTGGGAKICGAVSACCKALRMPTRIGAPYVSESVGEAYARPELSTVLGLTIYASANSSQTDGLISSPFADTVNRLKSFIFNYFK